MVPPARLAVDIVRSIARTADPHTFVMVRDRGTTTTSTLPAQHWEGFGMRRLERPDRSVRRSARVEM